MLRYTVTHPRKHEYHLKSTEIPNAWVRITPGPPEIYVSSLPHRLASYSIDFMVGHTRYNGAYLVFPKPGFNLTPILLIDSDDDQYMFNCKGMGGAGFFIRNSGTLRGAMCNAQCTLVTNDAVFRMRYQNTFQALVSQTKNHGPISVLPGPNDFKGMHQSLTKWKRTHHQTQITFN